MSKKEVLIRIGPTGAEVVNDLNTPRKVSDLVQTSAEDKVRMAVESVTTSVSEVSKVIFDVIDALADEAQARSKRTASKLTISFGISGGANAGLKLVGAKADAFITVHVEFASIGGQSK